MYCIKCGTRLDDKGKFCTSCGYKIEKNNRNKNGFLSKDSIGGKILAVGLVGCLLILACFVTKQIFFKHDNRDVIEASKTDSIINNERTDSAFSFNGTDVGDITVPSSLEDAIVQNGLFMRDIASDRNAAETLDEFEDADKEDLMYFLNNGKNWYIYGSDSILKFNSDGTYVENEYWGNGEYSIRKDFTLKIDENDEAYKRLVSKGTLVLSCDLLGNKEIYQYILYRRKENSDIYRLMMIDAIGGRIAYIYDSDLDGANYDGTDFPGYGYNISFDYDLSNPYNVDETLYTTTYNIILCLDKYLQGKESEDKTLENMKELQKKNNDASGTDNYKIKYYVDSLIECFQQHINNPNMIVNHSFGYKPINEILVTRAELLNKLGMQYFEYTRPYMD